MSTNQKILDIALQATKESIFSSIQEINRLHDELHRQTLSGVDQFLTTQCHPPAVSFCFLEMGSGGRGERTFWTDQDNAMIYKSDCMENDEIQPFLQQWAETAVQRLLAAGYPLCDGWVMANNPRWLQNIEGWKKQWTEWIRNLTANNIRFILLALDMRPVYGSSSLLQEFKEWIGGMDRSAAWIERVVLYSLNYPLPMGVFGNLLTSRYGDYAGLFHLKEGGYYQMVAIIRALSLLAGSQQASTVDRIAELHQKGYFSGEEKKQWEDCLSFYLYARLHQHTACFQNNQPLQDYANLNEWSSSDLDSLRSHLLFIRKQQKRWRREMAKKKRGGFS
ncbi:DUF294 nucleotidyltransferase-like domain-containing protein [Ammoniphilus sp. 3BR4]|uniref:DUF294 nucleotidyltransferase-like domain-containing protein n=1 Tax=Ammoniphilus sp. 3BR4 TaxID=3158265 RepID=UPI003466012C